MMPRLRDAAFLLCSALVIFFSIQSLFFTTQLRPPNLQFTGSDELGIVIHGVVNTIASGGTLVTAVVVFIASWLRLRPTHSSRRDQQLAWLQWGGSVLCILIYLSWIHHFLSTAGDFG